VIESFFEWLGNTPGSIALHEGLWAYPLIESVHVLALCLFLGTAIMLDLRLLGATLRSVRVSEVAQRLLPWTFVGFVLMVASGVLLVYGIPVRTYHSLFFRAKVVMLILAGLNAWVFHNTIYRRVAEWDLDPVPPKRAKAAAIFSLVLWAWIIIAGRMIAYNWFDCDRQPQPRIVNALAGCIPEAQSQ
jgi:hypothetical protein